MLSVDHDFFKMLITGVEAAAYPDGSKKHHMCEFLQKFYKDHGRQIGEISCQTRTADEVAMNRGPTVCSQGMKGYVIVVTKDNPYRAFKEICLGAVIIACGDDGIREYGSDFSDSDVKLLFEKCPDIEACYNRLLTAFLG